MHCNSFIVICCDNFTCLFCYTEITGSAVAVACILCKKPQHNNVRPFFLLRNDAGLHQGIRFYTFCLTLVSVQNQCSVCSLYVHLEQRPGCIVSCCCSSLVTDSCLNFYNWPDLRVSSLASCSFNSCYLKFFSF